MNLRPDPTFHASPKLAMEAPPENYAFTVMLSPDGTQSDGIAVIDLKLGSDTYGQIVHQVIVPNKGD
jgi:selenium-binding protein 1